MKSENAFLLEVIIKVSIVLIVYAAVICLIVLFDKPVPQKQAYKDELNALSSIIPQVTNSLQQLEISTMITQFESRWRKENDYFKGKSNADALSLRNQLYTYFTNNVLENPEFQN
jgi:hypothetical protein